MANTLALKATAGILAAGGISGGGYLIHSHLSNKTLNKDILSKNNKRVMSEGDSRWSVAFNKYKNKSKINDQYKVPNVLTTSSELEKWWLKGENSPHEESLYSKIEKLCTDPSISEYLETKGKALLTDFAAKISSYTSHSGDATLLVPSLGVDTSKTSVTAEQLRMWCGSSVNSEFKNEEDILYKRISQWCLEN